MQKRRGFYEQIMNKNIEKNKEIIAHIEEYMKEQEQTFADLNYLYNDQNFLNSLGANKNEYIKKLNIQRSFFSDLQKKAQTIVVFLESINKKLSEELNFIKQCLINNQYYSYSRGNYHYIMELKNQIISAKKEMQSIYKNLEIQCLILK